ncbi:MAG: SNF2 helicase associated domain-containing protein [Halanaerobiales bacterium]|nr:SNF2 helicase associated domain-containing protein [Halanaerobiales bacterium]
MLELFKAQVPSIIYERGKRYYRENRVVEYNLYKLDDNAYEIKSIVKGNDPYLVNIDLEFSTNTSMKLKGFCNCPFNKNWMCKHQVAVMIKFFIESLPKLNEGLSFSNPTFDKLLKFFDNPHQQPVSLKYKVKGLLSNNMVNFSINFSELEILEDELKELTNYIANKWDWSYVNSEMPFPLTEESFQVVEYLKNAETRSSRSIGTVLFPKSSGNFAFLYNLIKEQEIICHETGKIIQAGSVLKPSISVQGTEDKINIRLIEENFNIYSNPKDPLPNFWWTVIEDYLHPVNLAEVNSLPNEIHIPEDYKGKFLFEILPEFKKRYGAQLGDELQKYELSKFFPRICMNLDFQEEKIICEARIYIKDKEVIGSKTLDILNDNLYQRSESSSYIWHGIDREIIKQYIDFLEENNFLVSRDCFIIKDQEDIQNFLTSGFLHMPEDWEVSTTERFDQLEVILIELEPIVEISTEGSIDWFDFRVTYNLGGKTYTHQELQKKLKKNNQGESYIQIGNQYYVLYNDEKSRLIEENLHLAKKERKNYQSHFYNLLFYQNIFNKNGIHVKGDRIYNELREDLTNQNLIQDQELPDEIQNVLRDYQKTGYNWLRFLHKYRFSGILADDMGLGKTVQVLTLIKGINSDKPSLVICPRTLLYNWGEEIEKFFPSLKYIIYYGNPAERKRLQEQIDDYDIIITTYSIIGRDIDFLTKKSFVYCILDEAQHIKNYRTKRAESVKNIRAENRLILTGTPIENSVEELWALFDFLMPGYLDTHSSFKKKFLTPIKDHADVNVLNELKQRVAPFILRRNKAEVLTELPKKMVQVSKVSMTQLQEDTYKTILSQVRHDVLSAVQEKGFLRSQITVLSALTKLRQICNHPKLILQDLDEKISSGKLEALLEIVREAIASGHKMLIFSQFVKMLRIIEDEFKNAGVTYEYLDGSTKNRMERVKKFNEDPAINAFLISLKAGGTGLNLTSADIVIHVDPWWNPMVENQATDRAYRIGQKNKVMVYKLITAGSVEEKMLRLQEKKKNIFDAVIEQNTGALERLTWEDVQELFEI